MIKSQKQFPRESEPIEKGDLPPPLESPECSEMASKTRVVRKIGKRAVEKSALESLSARRVRVAAKGRRSSRVGYEYGRKSSMDLLKDNRERFYRAIGRGVAEKISLEKRIASPREVQPNLSAKHARDTR